MLFGGIDWSYLCFPVTAPGFCGGFRTFLGLCRCNVGWLGENELPATCEHAISRFLIMKCFV